MTVRAWLEQEVRDYLDVGAVGLYELITLLRTSEFEISETEAHSISKELVTDLINGNSVRLCMLKWPMKSVLEGPLPTSILDDPQSWDWLPEDSYLALVPG